MRKKLSRTILIVLISLVIGIFIGISLTSLTPSMIITTTTTITNNKVCCHSFGFGSEMKRCCDKYEWTTADGCKVPEGMVGGGKEIIDNSYCTSTQTTTTIPNNKQECEAKGGKWGLFGIALIERCNLPTSDGGKTCTDRSQCEGLCLAENVNSTVGKCTAWRMTFGCVNILENGTVMTICID